MISVPGIFAEGILADRFFAEGIFAEWNFRRTLQHDNFES